MKALVLIALFSLLLAGCTQAPKDTSNLESTISPGGLNIEGGAKAGSLVKVDYVGSLANGTVFDTSVESEAKKAGLVLRPAYAPLPFTVGAGQMIAGFDKAVVGMKVGEEKTITIPPEDAYGPVQQNLMTTVTQPPQPIVTVELSQFGADAPTLNPGADVSTATGAPGKVVSVNATHVVIDFSLKVGMSERLPDGSIGKIVSANATSAVVDFNHELAGKTLIFKITMREIKPA